MGLENENFTELVNIVAMQVSKYRGRKSWC